MKTTFKILSLLLLGMSAWLSGNAQNYIAVSKEGKVYDEASAKYVTLNQDNEDVNVIPGMVFSSSQHTPGWYKIEYSPGLHAFIPEQIIATGFSQVGAGSYDISNYPGHKLTVEESGEDWSATVDGKNYKGKKFENILIFSDVNNIPSFSLVDLGDGPIAISYDNSLTKFF